MSIHHSKLSTGIKICRGKSIPNYKNIKNTQNGKIEYNDNKMMENIPNFKMNYTNNFFFVIMMNITTAKIITLIQLKKIMNIIENLAQVI